MTAQNVFLAGASGAIGKRLVPQLIEAGHKVFGTTRFPEKAAALRELGATPVVVDIFDHPKLAHRPSPRRVANVHHRTGAPRRADSAAEFLHVGDLLR